MLNEDFIKVIREVYERKLKGRRLPLGVKIKAGEIFGRWDSSHWNLILDAMLYLANNSLIKIPENEKSALKEYEFKSRLLELNINDYDAEGIEAEIDDRAVFKNMGITDIKFEHEAVIIKDKVCKIRGDLRIAVCKALFSKPIGEIFTQDELETSTDALFDSAQHSSRRVYDATQGINDQVKECFGIDELIGYNNAKFWIKQELFKH